jgi:DNA recombination protein RmuC
MLFVPVEGAYICLMQANPQLWQHAYKKRVLLISPTNLIAAMKLVYDLWKREGINQNAQEIAGKAVRIYEKLAAFVEDFEKVGSQLEKASNSFIEAKKKLHTGKGNLISTASQMKLKVHHTKPVRELPLALVEEAERAEDELFG